MAKIELIDVAHAYAPGQWAVKDINLTWEDGVASALLGPSGCGKTTLLKIISGLLQPSQGRVLIDGKDVTELDPRERNVAQVFQFPVVYETLSVYDNLAFPLRNRGVSASTVKTRVNDVAEMLGLTDVLKKNANRLGAAEKQRISLGRGIVREDTTAVLFDEPLTVIDPHMKWHLRRQLKEVQHRLKMTMIYVTHDQHEALTFADQVTVMNVGAALQTGSPQDLHERPRAPFVGYFIGSPGMNVFPATLEGNTVRAGVISVPIPAEQASTIVNNKLEVGIRPEFVKVSTEDLNGGFKGIVTNTHLTANSRIVEIDGAALVFKARLDETSNINVGDSVSVVFPDENTMVYVDEVAIDRATEEIPA
ncbi:MAG: ABC transporter ATP-binding protein [Chloroflexota bacterium]